MVQEWAGDGKWQLFISNEGRVMTHFNVDGEQRELPWDEFKGTYIPK